MVESDKEKVAERLLEQLLGVVRGDGESGDATSKLATEPARFARTLIEAVRSSSFAPEAWEAMLKGELSPLDASKFRPVDSAGYSRGWGQIEARSLKKMQTKVASVQEAARVYELARTSLEKAKDELVQAESEVAACRVMMVLREMGNYTVSVFAMGPAWTLLKALAESGKVDSSRMQKTILTLAQRGNDPQFLSDLAAAIAESAQRFDLPKGAAKTDLDINPEQFGLEKDEVFATLTASQRKEVVMQLLYGDDEDEAPPEPDDEETYF